MPGTQGWGGGRKVRLQQIGPAISPFVPAARDRNCTWPANRVTPIDKATGLDTPAQPRAMDYFIKTILRVCTKSPAFNRYK